MKASEIREHDEIKNKTIKFLEMRELDIEWKFKGKKLEYIHQSTLE